MKFTFEQSGRLKYIPKYGEISFQNNGISVFPYSIRNNSTLSKGIIQNLPYITIHAYAQNTILNEIVNLVGEAFNGLKTALDTSGGEENTGTDKHFTAKDLLALAKKLQEICSGLTTQKGNESFIETIVSRMNTSMNINFLKNDVALEQFPAFLYYTLLGVSRVGKYKLPFVDIEGYMQTTGIYGYSKSSNVFSGVLGNNTLLKFALGNIGLNIMPIFHPGDTTDDTTISFTVNLINDEWNDAKKNIEFLCSLFGGNKWVQYGFVQFPGALYDIVIPGAMRYMLCTGTFSVEPIGSVRKLKKEIVVGPSNFKFSYIPDVYSLKLQFSTLLPNNFNTFLYGMWLEEDKMAYEGVDSNKSNIPAFIEGLTEALLNISYGEEDVTKLYDKRNSAAEKLMSTKSELETTKKQFETGYKDDAKTVELNQNEWNNTVDRLNELEKELAAAEKEYEAANRQYINTAYAVDQICQELKNDILTFLAVSPPYDMANLIEKYNGLSEENKKTFNEKFNSPSITEAANMSPTQFITDNADELRRNRLETNTQSSDNTDNNQS